MRSKRDAAGQRIARAIAALALLLLLACGGGGGDGSSCSAGGPPPSSSFSLSLLPSLLPAAGFFLVRSNSSHLNTPSPFFVFGVRSFALSGELVRASPADGCSSMALSVNATGKVVWIEPYHCSIETKIRHCAAAGCAAAVSSSSYRIPGNEMWTQWEGGAPAGGASLADEERSELPVPFVHVGRDDAAVIRQTLLEREAHLKALIHERHERERRENEAAGATTLATAPVALAAPAELGAQNDKSDIDGDSADGAADDDVPSFVLELAGSPNASALLDFHVYLSSSDAPNPWQQAYTSLYFTIFFQAMLAGLHMLSTIVAAVKFKRYWALRHTRPAYAHVPLVCLAMITLGNLERALYCAIDPMGATHTMPRAYRRFLLSCSVPLTYATVLALTFFWSEAVAINNGKKQNAKQQQEQQQQPQLPLKRLSLQLSDPPLLRSSAPAPSSPRAVHAEPPRAPQHLPQMQSHHHAQELVRLQPYPLHQHQQHQQRQHQHQQPLQFRRNPQQELASLRVHTHSPALHAVASPASPHVSGHYRYGHASPMGMSPLGLSRNLERERAHSAQEPDTPPDSPPQQQQTLASSRGQPLLLKPAAQKSSPQRSAAAALGPALAASPLSAPLVRHNSSSSSGNGSAGVGAASAAKSPSNSARVSGSSPRVGSAGQFDEPLRPASASSSSESEEDDDEEDEDDDEAEEDVQQADEEYFERERARGTRVRGSSGSAVRGGKPRGRGGRAERGPRISAEQAAARMDFELAEAQVAGAVSSIGDAVEQHPRPHRSPLKTHLHAPLAHSHVHSSLRIAVPSAAASAAASRGVQLPPPPPAPPAIPCPPLPLSAGNMQLHKQSMYSSSSSSSSAAQGMQRSASFAAMHSTPLYVHLASGEKMQQQQKRAVAQAPVHVITAQSQMQELRRSLVSPSPPPSASAVAAAGVDLRDEELMDIELAAAAAAGTAGAASPSALGSSPLVPHRGSSASFSTQQSPRAGLQQYQLPSAQQRELQPTPVAQLGHAHARNRRGSDELVRVGVTTPSPAPGAGGGGDWSPKSRGGPGEEKQAHQSHQRRMSIVASKLKQLLKLGDSAGSSSWSSPPSSPAPFLRRYRTAFLLSTAFLIALDLVFSLLDAWYILDGAVLPAVEVVFAVIGLLIGGMYAAVGVKVVRRLKRDGEDRIQAAKHNFALAADSNAAASASPSCGASPNNGAMLDGSPTGSPLLEDAAMVVPGASGGPTPHSPHAFYAYPLAYVPPQPLMLNGVPLAAVALHPLPLHHHHARGTSPLMMYPGGAAGCSSLGVGVDYATASLLSQQESVLASLRQSNKDKLVRTLQFLVGSLVGLMLFIAVCFASPQLWHAASASSTSSSSAASASSSSSSTTTGGGSGLGALDDPLTAISRDFLMFFALWIIGGCQVLAF